VRPNDASHTLISLCLLAITSFCVATAHAEYRVFVLKIEDSTTGQSRTVETTLDHLQYAGYYPVRSNEKVTIQETWMCRNRSDLSQDIEQKYCLNPRSPASVPKAPQP
jgi:hypothetical protein